ncbi:MAG: hypothetical protein OXC95_10675 [Dehalococcoidia bacterium]|nr:hypothetical protein [Dehalococcoidia bacterium]
MANTTNANPTLVAAFAVIALGLVLTALVLMYWREPAFLTFSGDQALDLRKLETILERMPPELVDVYFEDVARRSLEIDKPRTTERSGITTSDEVAVVEQQLDMGES